MRIVPVRRTSRMRLPGRFLHPGSPEFSTGTFLTVARPDSVTGGVGWASASKPIALPFALPEPVVVTHLGIANGTGPGGTFDIGIYTEGWVRLGSTGSTAGSGAAAWQWVNITDLPLASGRYYLCASRNDTNTQRNLFYASSNAYMWGWLGVMDSATNAHPLPDPLTNMVSAATFGRVPCIAMATRAPF